MFANLFAWRYDYRQNALWLRIQYCARHVIVQLGYPFVNTASFTWKSPADTSTDFTVDENAYVCFCFCRYIDGVNWGRPSINFTNGFDKYNCIFCLNPTAGNWNSSYIHLK